MLEWLKEAYSWTIITDNNAIDEILAITDFWIGNTVAVNLAWTFVNNNLWASVSSSSSSSSSSSWGAIGNDEFTKLLIHSDDSNLSLNDTFDWTDANTLNWYDVWSVNATKNDELILTWWINENSNVLSNYLLAPWDFNIEIDLVDFFYGDGASRTHFGFNDWYINTVFDGYKNNVLMSLSQWAKIWDIYDDTVLNRVSSAGTMSSWKFRVRREWSTWYTEYWNGSSWIVVNSAATNASGFGRLSINWWSIGSSWSVKYDNLVVHSWTVVSSKFDDSSSSNHDITTYWDAYHKEAEKKFWATSMYFDGVNDYLEIPDSTDWDFESGDFTIDWWIYPTQFSQHASIVSHWESEYKGWQLDYDNSSWHLRFIASVDGSSPWDIDITSTTAPTLNTWNHVAVVRNWTTVNLYLNGINISSDSSSDINITGISSVFKIGKVTWAAAYYKWYIDELRISKWIARWTENFTP